jgi:hypothetical protein
MPCFRCQAPLRNSSATCTGECAGLLQQCNGNRFTPQLFAKWVRDSCSGQVMATFRSQYPKSHKNSAKPCASVTAQCNFGFFCVTVRLWLLQNNVLVSETRHPMQSVWCTPVSQDPN